MTAMNGTCGCRLIDRSGLRVTRYASKVEPGSAGLNAELQKALAEWQPAADKNINCLQP